MGSLYNLAKTAAQRWPGAVALRSQSEHLVMSFAALEREANAMAVVLSTKYAPGTALVSDLQNVAQNVVLQVACSKLGVAYATTKKLSGLEKLAETVEIAGVVHRDDDSEIKTAVDKPLSIANLQALTNIMREAQEEVATRDRAPDHAYFNSTTALTNDEIDRLAADAATHLELAPGDAACVSVTLCHAFGIGSAAAACLSAGAAIVLPNVDGIAGCGVPSERAAATMLALEADACTVLYADTHTLKALPADAALPALRGGVCKVASGSDFLARSSPFAGRDLWTLGKRD